MLVALPAFAQKAPRQLASWEEAVAVWSANSTDARIAAAEVVRAAGRRRVALGASLPQFSGSGLASFSLLPSPAGVTWPPRRSSARRRIKRSAWWRSSRSSICARGTRWPRRSLGTAVFGGMALSTVLTLFFTPLLFVWVDRLTSRGRTPALRRAESAQ